MTIEIGTSCPEGHALSNRANPSSTPSCNLKLGDHLMATTTPTTNTFSFIIVIIITDIIITLCLNKPLLQL